MSIPLIFCTFTGQLKRMHQTKETATKNPNAFNGEVLELDSKTSIVGKKMFIESYGCQMNFSDSEIVASILSEAGYKTTSQLNDADLILVNTCSIREKAEQTVLALCLQRRNCRCR